MRRTYYAIAAVFVMSCGNPAVKTDAAIADDAGWSAPNIDAGTTADAGYQQSLPWPQPLSPGECTLVRTDLPNNTWENTSVYDLRAKLLVHSGGHVLGGYPQSAYTFRFRAPSFETEPARPARLPQRRCLVDGSFAASIGESIWAHGNLEHGSLNPGHFKDGYTRIGLQDTPGPWLYNAITDDWQDARPVGQQMDVRHHSPMAWDAASDTVVSLGQNYLQLYHVHSNQVFRRALPAPLENRVFYGIAADPYSKRIVVVGGSTGVFHSQLGDAGVNYLERVKNDTWLYDIARDAWEEVLTDERPPKGVPGRDFVKFSAVWEPITGNIVYRVIPLNEYISDATLWPAAETWALNVAARRWVQLELQHQPRFQGQLSYDSERQRLLILGGGVDANARPALSRHLFDCSLPTAGPALLPAEPRELSALTRDDGAVELAWTTASAGTAVVLRALATPWPTHFEQIGRVDAATGQYVDLTAQRTQAYAYEIRIGTHPAAAPVLTAPRRPHGLIASVESSAEVRLEWAAHPASDVVGYRVWRARGGSAGVALTSTLTTLRQYVDTSVDLSDNVIRRYWVTAVNRGGVEGGPSPQAYTVPEAPQAASVSQTGPRTYVVTWAAPNQRTSRFDVFHINTHRNTLNEADPFGPTGWYGEVAALVPQHTQSESLSVTIADTDTAPHHYFWVRAVNVLGQGGMITDIMSATDSRFYPQVSPLFAPP